MTKPVLVLKADGAALSQVPGNQGVQLTVGGDKNTASVRDLFRTAFGRKPQQPPKQSPPQANATGGPTWGQRAAAGLDLLGRGAAAAATIDQVVNSMQGGNLAAPLGAPAIYQGNIPFRTQKLPQQTQQQTQQGQTGNVAVTRPTKGPPTRANSTQVPMNQVRGSLPPGVSTATPPGMQQTTQAQAAPTQVTPDPQAGMAAAMQNPPVPTQAAPAATPNTADLAGPTAAQVGTTMQQTPMPGANVAQTPTYQTNLSQFSGAPQYTSAPLTSTAHEQPASTQNPLDAHFAALGAPQQQAATPAAPAPMSYATRQALNTLSPQGSWQNMVNGLHPSWGYPEHIGDSVQWGGPPSKVLGDTVGWGKMEKAFAPFCFTTEDGMLRKATPHEVGLYAALRYLGWI